MKRRSRGGTINFSAIPGISITNDDNTQFVNINLDNNDHLIDLFNIVCGNKSLEDILAFRRVLNDIYSDINNKKIENITDDDIQHYIQLLAPYANEDIVKNLITILQTMKPSISVENGDNEEIEQKTTENNNIVNDKEIENQKILQQNAEQIIKNDDELNELYKQTINDVEDIQKKSQDLFREADNIEQITGNEKTNEITKKVDDLMKDVGEFTDSKEIEIKEQENINRDIEKEQNLGPKLVKIFNEDLEEIYKKHPVLYDIIFNKKYKPVYRLPLLRAIAIIQNREDRNSLIYELEKILGNMTITDELTKIISELNLIKNSDVGEFKYGGKIRFNRKRKSSKRKSSKKKQNK